MIVFSKHRRVIEGACLAALALISACSPEGNGAENSGGPASGKGAAGPVPGVQTDTASPWGFGILVGRPGHQVPITLKPDREVRAEPGAPPPYWPSAAASAKGGSPGARSMSIDAPGSRVLASGGAPTFAAGGTGGAAPVIDVGSPWLLVRAAAAECGFSDTSPSSDAAIRVHPYLAGIAPVVPSWWKNADGSNAFSIFPAAPTSCEEVLVQEEALLCVAKELDEAATTVGVLQWNHVSNLPPLPGVPSGPWTIPPQSDESRFLARDLALHMLANLARTDLEIPSNAPQGEIRTCADLYGAATKDSTFAVQNATTLFGVASGSAPAAYFPPDDVVVDADHASSIAAARLLVQAHVLRSAGRLLHDIVSDGVRDDVTLAASRAFSSPTRGTDVAWGLDVPAGEASYNSLPHAIRLLSGRLDMGPGTPDRACSGSTASQALPVGYGAAFDARSSTTAIETASQLDAVRTVIASGLLLPTAAIDAASADELRTMLREQLVGNAAISQGLAPTDASFSQGLTAQAVDAQLAALQGDDLRLAFRRTNAFFRLSADAADVDPSHPLLAETLSSYTSKTATKYGGVAADRSPGGSTSGLKINKGASASSACRDPSSLWQGILAQSQCDELAGADNADRAYGAPYQNTVTLAQSLYHRLVRVREAAGGIGDVFAVASGGAAELRAWEGSTGFEATVTSTGGQANSVSIKLVGVDAKTLPSLDTALLSKSFQLTRGPAWMGECAGHARSDCPHDFDTKYAVFPSSVTVTTPTDDPTIVSTYATDGIVVTLTFDLSAAGTGFARDLVQLGNASAPFLLGYRATSAKSPSAVYLSFSAFDKGTGSYTATGTANDGLVRLGTQVIAPCAGGDGDAPHQDPATPRTSCLGQKTPPFIAIENDVTGAAPSADDSWRHYVSLAKSAAQRADDLGQKLVDVGLQQDMRREAAGEELAKICGDVSAAGKVNVAAGQVSTTDPTLSVCLNEDTYDLVYLSQRTAAPSKQDLSDELQCGPGQVGESDPLCTKLKPLTDADIVFGAAGNDPGKFYVGSLNLSPPPGADPSQQKFSDACGSIGDAVQSVSSVAPDLSGTVLGAGFASLDTMQKLSAEISFVRGDLAGNWSLSFIGAPVMSTDPTSGLWPGCIRPGAPAKGVCDSAAFLFAKLFQSGAARDSATGPCQSNEVPAGLGCLQRLGPGNVSGLAEGDELALLMWRVEGALWTIGGMGGKVPGSMFTTTIPIADFSTDLTSAPLFNIFGDSRFQQNASGFAFQDASNIQMSLGSFVGAANGGICFGSTPPNGESKVPYPAWAIGPDCDSDHYHLTAQPVSERAWKTAPSSTSLLNAQTTILKGVSQIRCDAGGRPRFAGLSLPLAAPSLWPTVAALKAPDGLAPYALPDQGYQVSQTSDEGGADFVIRYPIAEAFIPADGMALQNYRTTAGSPNPDCIDDAKSTTVCPIQLPGAVPTIEKKCVDPMSCPIEDWNQTAITLPDRAFLFVNSYPPREACGAATEFLGALGLACHFYNDPVAVQSQAPPPIQDINGFLTLSAWVGSEAIRTQNAVAMLHLKTVPARAVDDFRKGLVGTGSGQGTEGAAVLEMEQSIQTMYQSWVQVIQDLSLVSEALKTAQLEVDAANIKTLTVEHDIAIQVLQVHQAQAQALVGIISAAAQFGNGENVGGGILATAGAIANAAVVVSYGDKQLAELDQLSALAMADQDNSFAKAINDLNTTTTHLYADLSTALSQVRSATAGTLEAASDIQSARAQAAYEAAKASSSAPDFVAVGGVNVPIRVNAVLAHQYDLTKVRYDAALSDAKYLACIARLSVEQRLGARLSGISDPIGPGPAPKQWADDFSLSGIDYSELSCTTSTTDPGCLAKLLHDQDHAFIGDYAARLESFVDEYDVEYPFQDTEDTVILSFADDVLSKQITCTRPSINVLASSSRLDQAKVDASGAVVAGWQKSGCSQTKCLEAIPVATIDGAAGGHATLLRERAPMPALPAAPPGVPPNFVYQELALAAGTYELSWWAAAVGTDGSPSGTPGSFEVVLFDGDWNVVATVPAYSYAGTATDYWGPRASATLTIPNKGTFRVAISVSTSDGGMGAIAISDVQLESVAASSATPSPYEDTDLSDTIYTGKGCHASGADVRSAFERKCSAGGCVYVAKPFAIRFYPTTGLPASGLESKFAGGGTYNYRTETIAVNLVGTDVHDCGPTPSSSCFGSGYETFDLAHDAHEVWLANPVDGADVFNFGAAKIQSGKALAAEKYLTLPLGSSDQGLVSQTGISRVELEGRPLDGQYRLTIHDSPSLRWDRLQDVQIVVKYHYWSNTAGANP